MKRILFLAAAFMVFAVGMVNQRTAVAGAAQESPEATASAFYTWFLKHDSDQTYPLREKDIEKYMAPQTVERLKNDYAHSGPPNGVDYFLKVQDYDSQEWLAHMVTHPAVMLDGVAIVPITLGAKEKVDVLVFMRKLDGKWKITKVDDTWDYK